MTITFTALESTHETAAGTHRRRLQQLGNAASVTTSIAYAVGAHRRTLRTVGYAQTVAAGDAVGWHRRRVRSAGVTKSLLAVGSVASGSHWRRCRTLGTAVAGALDIDPEIPAMGVHQRRYQTEGDTFASAYEFGEHQRRLRPLGYAGSADMAGGECRRALRSLGLDDSAEFGSALLVAYPFFVSSYGGQWFERTVEEVALATNAQTTVTALLREILLLASPVAPQVTAYNAIREDMALGAMAHVALFESIVEALATTTAVTETPQFLNRVLERILLTGQVSSLSEAQETLVEALVFRALADAAVLETTTEALLTSDSLSLLYEGAEKAVSLALFADEASTTSTMMLLVEEKLALSVDLTSEADLAQLVRENLGMVGRLALDSGEFIAWTMNTESRGLTTYNHFPFNSFMRVGGTWIGVGADGLHRLEGDDDNGTPIAARLRLGMDSLGTRALKRIPEAFIGYTGDGRLLLRVILVDDATGEKIAAEYRVKPRPAGATRESRAEIGKGLRAVDFDFEIENIDGGDFDISSIQFYPLVLDRRTRG